MALLNKENFLKARAQFKLGTLTTESIHPKTKNLSKLVNEDCAQAVELLQKIDIDVFDQLVKYIPRIYDLAASIQIVKNNGGKLFLCGCGATGRLSLALEAFYRQVYGDDFIISFMAGGDYALIKSVESFEDSKEYGATQIMELGFSDNDLLLAITEGGETSFVIGACEKAANVSDLKPYFIYCNPNEELKEIERSQNVIENESIIKLNINIGPMALAGSTRMQATTAQMLVVAFALQEYHNDYDVFEKKIISILSQFRELDFQDLPTLISYEANHYKDGIITYLCSHESGMTVLTDTTERSPTFSLQGFEKDNENHFSLSYLAINNTYSSEDAWKSLLQRDPRCLEWKDSEFDLSIEQLRLFDISENSIERRNKKKNQIIHVKNENTNYRFDFANNSILFKTPFEKMIYREIALKTYLNIHSTALMGILERYQGNVMTYVRPSNLKLIDRSIRYISELLNHKISEDKIIDTLFEQLDYLDSDESIVMKVVKILEEKEKVN